MNNKLTLGDMITTTYGLTNRQKQRVKDVKELYKNLIDFIDIELSDSREKSLSITKLEEALMWTTRSISKESTSPFSSDN